MVIIILLLVFTIATAWIALRTYSVPDQWSGPKPPGRTAYAFAMADGTAVLHYWRFSSGLSQKTARHNVFGIVTVETRPFPGAVAYSRTWPNPCPHALAVDAKGAGGLLKTTDLWFSVWLIPASFSIYPLFVVGLAGALRRRRRRRKGLCVKCGYDLTGLPQRRCPECGTEF
jgi:hypothetical protein